MVSFDFLPVEEVEYFLPERIEIPEVNIEGGERELLPLRGSVGNEHQQTSSPTPPYSKQDSA